DVGPFRSVEINSSYSNLPQKDIAGNSPLGSPALSRRNDLNNLANSFHMDSVLQEQAFQQQILQAQQQQLAEQHEQQLRQQLKEFYEQKKQMEEERERREKERLEALKKKEKHEQSAVASTEVKQKL
ncbi:hypothetical protein J437_LFUL017960, partial [Ladona fulva]